MLIIRMGVDLSVCPRLRDEGGRMPTCREEQGLGVLSLLRGQQACVRSTLLLRGRAGWKVLYKGEQGLFGAAEREETAGGVTVWVGNATQTAACSRLNLEHMFRGGLQAVTATALKSSFLFSAKGRIQLRNINSLS